MLNRAYVLSLAGGLCLLTARMQGSPPIKTNVPGGDPRPEDFLAWMEDVPRDGVERAPWEAQGVDGSIFNLFEATDADRYLWNASREEITVRATQTFFAKYPEDARRWQLLAKAVTANRPFLREVHLSERGGQTFVFDERARAGWYAQERRWLRESLRAPDLLSPETKGRLLRHYGHRLESEPEVTGEQVMEFREAVTAFDQAFPDNGQIRSAYDSILRCLPGGELTTESTAFLQLAAKSSNVEVAAWARGKQLILRSQLEPLKLKFNATDGALIDLESLRGKVVLIDFWAMWCSPCVAEIPSMVKLYRTYHSAGLEIIGINCDFRKQELAFQAFIKKNEMNWRHCFEGTGPKNAYTSQLAVTGLPCYVVIDRKGRVVSTRLRGQALEESIANLLGDPNSENPAGGDHTLSGSRVAR